MSKEEFAKTTPVRPPTVKRKMKPKDHNIGVSEEITVLFNVVIQLKILIPVGMAIIMVAAVK